MRNYNKYKKYGKKKKIISPLKVTTIILALLATMSIGYSVYTDTVRIDGTANIGSFTIQYELDGGTNVANPITMYYATTNAPLPIPTKTGFSFGGWYESSDFSGSSISTTPTRKWC